MEHATTAATVAALSLSLRHDDNDDDDAGKTHHVAKPKRTSKTLAAVVVSSEDEDNFDDDFEDCEDPTFVGQIVQRRKHSVLGEHGVTPTCKGLFDATKTTITAAAAAAAGGGDGTSTSSDVIKSIRDVVEGETKEVVEKSKNMWNELEGAKEVDNTLAELRENLTKSAKKLNEVKANSGIDELVADSAKLFKDLGTSREASILTDTSKRLVNCFETSETGRKTLGVLSTLMEDRADEVVEIVGKIADKTKETLQDAAENAATSERVEASVGRVKRATESLLVGRIAANNKKAASEFISESMKRTTEATSAGLRTLDALTADRTTTRIPAEQMKEQIEWLKANKIGNKALSGVNRLLERVERDGIDNSIESAQAMLADPSQRKKFFKQVKDAALGWMMEYIPTVRVPVIEDTAGSGSVKYKLENIRISRFRIKSEDVSILIVKGTELHLRVDNIFFDVRKIKWSYEQLGFPYMSGGGMCDCVSKRTKLIAVFRLELVDQVLKLTAATENQGLFVLAKEKTMRARKKEGKEEEEEDNVAAVIDTTSTKALLRNLRKETKDRNSLLVMDTPYIKLHHLELSIRDSSLAFIYNALVSIFSEYVAKAMEVALVTVSLFFGRS
eukprot:g3846.t1